MRRAQPHTHTHTQSHTLKSPFWMTPWRMFSPTSLSTDSMAMLVLPAPGGKRTRGGRGQIKSRLTHGVHGTKRPVTTARSHQRFLFFTEGKRAKERGDLQPVKLTGGRAHEHVFVAEERRLVDAALDAVERLEASERHLRTRSHHTSRGPRRCPHPQGRGGMARSRARAGAQCAGAWRVRLAGASAGRETPVSHLRPVGQLGDVHELLVSWRRQAGRRRHRHLLVALVRPAGGSGSSSGSRASSTQGGEPSAQGVLGTLLGLRSGEPAAACG